VSAARAASLDLDLTDGSAGRCRRFLLDLCMRWRCEDVAPDAALVVSELVTNAIRHAKTPSQLRVRLAQGVLRVEVVDGSTAMPELRRPDPDEPTGRGLLLVAAVSLAWGAASLGGGKVVWAELACAP
jgi:two-component sensor histidine kinase